MLILFRDKCFRANRSSLYENNNFNCVYSPNYHPLIDFQCDIEIDADAILKPKEKDFSVWKNLSRDVYLIKLQPFLNAELFRVLLNERNVKGITPKTVCIWSHICLYAISIIVFSLVISILYIWSS